MDFDAIDDFVYDVIGIIGSDQKNLSCAADFALKSSKEKSYPPKLLLELSNACKQQKMHLEEYVFAKVCLMQASGKLREDSCYALGIAAHVLGFSPEAEASYLEVLNENPENADVRCAYSELLLELGRVQEAENEYKTVLETSPENVKANTGYAYLLAEYGHVDEAEECYSRALAG
ncbi:hypothetical protein EO95_01515, partial [Methanosarcina sp. 1.H.T.1A.1]|uniref:tetratricopeptide repeat protein n=2 Tax=Methanosarcina TaxID=2207 RepID=UPI000622318E